MSAPWVSPWQAPFPAPYELPYFQWNPSGSRDENGNQIPAWFDVVMIKAQGWDMLTSEQLVQHQDEERFDAYLELPVDLWLGIQDRIGLPLPSNGMVAPTDMFDDEGHENKGIFEVTGHDIESYGPQMWTPGNIVLLKLVEG